MAVPHRGPGAHDRVRLTREGAHFPLQRRRRRIRPVRNRALRPEHRDSTLRFLELFNSDRFADVSLNQWLTLTPQQLVADHLHLSQDAMSKLQKKKRPVVA